MTNYFEFFNLPIQFNIDLKALRSQYIANSKLYHPDFHTLSSDSEQDKVLEQSTINNEGWKTLSDPQKRTAHILEINNALPEEGQAKVPQEFLMDMMDINEALMELEFDPDPTIKEKVTLSIRSLEEELNKEGQAAMDAWDEDQEDGFLTVVRDYYLKMKYLSRIKEKIK